MLALLAALLLGAPGCASGQLPAFPGAEGFGATTSGGRGGDVFVVTTLEDYGVDEAPIEGSLRAAVEAPVPRTILFRVSGNIELKRLLEVDHPNLTIAGQSAPGEGITLRNFGILINAPHVVIRYLRVRPGDVAGEEMDAIDIRGSYVVIDHCSASWGTDEVVSVTGGATNVTVQWTLISESLNESVHSKGPHGYGTLIDDADSVSVHHSVYAFHRSRNPRPKDAVVDFRNNLIYGWGDAAGYNVDDQTRINYVGNYLRPLDYSRNETVAFHIGSAATRIYADGNVLHGDEERSADNRRMMRLPDDTGDRVFVEQPFDTPPITMHPADDLVDVLLDQVGASRPARDAVDRRVLGLIHAGEGRIIDSQDEVGGWPALAPGEPPLDSDGDGMPDEWELAHGLNPHDPADHRGDLDGDGYTNLEEYLNGTDPREPFRPRTP